MITWNPGVVRRASATPGVTDLEEELMPGGAVHTVHKDGKWFNEVEGQSPTGGAHDRKDDAVQAGRELARDRQVEHVIHGTDGRIHERNSYGNDPRDVKG